MKIDDEINHDLSTIITPVNVDVLERLLKASKYNKEETSFLVNGFRNGFDLGYQSPWNRRDTSRNIPFQVGVGDKFDMWSKIMKEVKAKHYAGPYHEIPFQHYIQLPIGLVPKAGNKTRLIFHLSYDFGEDEIQKLVNYFTPEKLCTVKYNDINMAVMLSLKMIEEIRKGIRGGCLNKPTIYYSKTHLMSTFRILPLKKKCYSLVVLKAKHPITNETLFFVEKNLPFGHSISCSHFQRFSNGLRHIYEYMIRVPLSMVNYSDDFLFLAPSQALCNRKVRNFLALCKEIGVPVAIEKTEWANVEIIFLGILLNGRKHILTVPQDKKSKTVNWINYLLLKKSCTVKELEQITGLLNFLGRAIVLGRAFTRRMYAKFTGAKNIGLKGYHHIRLDSEFKKDCRMWLNFLQSPRKTGVARPFIDYYGEDVGVEVKYLLSDATAVEKLGFGVIYNTSWTFKKWEDGFIARYNPSIEFLELYALCIGVFIWSNKLPNTRFILFCDNQSVCNMI